MSNIYNYDVFISHSYKDKEDAKHLDTKLKEFGFHTWCTAEEPLSERIVDAMEDSAVCMLLLGPSGNSPWVDDYVWLAIRDRIKRTYGMFRVILVLLPGVVSEDLEKATARQEMSISGRRTGAFVRFEKNLEESDAIRQLILKIRGADSLEESIWSNAFFREQVRYRAKNAFNIDWTRLMVKLTEPDVSSPISDVPIPVYFKEPVIKNRQAGILGEVKNAIPPELVGKWPTYYTKIADWLATDGPQGDAGTTGRHKITVDTYCGYGPHDGGAFSGKDITKVDRSATYMARYAAKNIVAAGLADRCLVQLAYAMGVSDPVSVLIDRDGTGRISESMIATLIREHFRLTPRGIIEDLRLQRPIYKRISTYGHFSCDGEAFTWDAMDNNGIPRGSERRGLRAEGNSIHRERASDFSFDKIIGRSPVMQYMLRVARRVAECEVSSVILQGEPGTGKTTTARAIHYASKHVDSPFIPINCGALPTNLIEMELFGYESGAFTDAKVEKEGLLEQVDDGTIFLYGISELDINLQSKLLRVLQEGSFRRIGGQKNLNFRAHVIAASNRDLRRECEAGRFLYGLYHRLAVIEIAVPPLRERGDDVLLLAEYFLNTFGLSIDDASRLAPEMARALGHYNWPGNVRELRDAIERAVTLEDRDKILSNHTLFGIAPDQEFQPLRCACPSEMEEDAAMNLPHEDILQDRIETFFKKARSQSDSDETRAVKLLGLAPDQVRFHIQMLKRWIEADTR